MEIVNTINAALAEAAQLAWNTAMNANPIGIGALKLVTNNQNDS